MAINRYLAMTAAEIASSAALPTGLGYMACHFSPYGTGLCNLPGSLPEGAILILNDRTPIRGHDSRQIVNRLRELAETLKCGSILLDFERPDVEEAAGIARAVLDGLPCSVGVSELYARELDCPVFLPPVPCDTSLSDYLAPWRGREIWLEAALDSLCITLTTEGAHISPPLFSEGTAPLHHDSRLHCRYQIHEGEAVRFTFHRRPEDLETLLAEAEGLGVTRAIGLYQELRGIWT